MFGKIVKSVLNTVSKDVSREVNVALGSKYEYYAVIGRSGMFYNGEIKDIPLDRVNVRMCSTTDELIKKLTDKLTAEIERYNANNQPYPAKTPLETLKAQYPGKEIIAIRANIK